MGLHNGETIEETIIPRYITDVLNLVDIERIRGRNLKIVMDFGNGVQARVAPSWKAVRPCTVTRLSSVTTRSPGVRRRVRAVASQARPNSASAAAARGVSGVVTSLGHADVGILDRLPTAPVGAGHRTRSRRRRGRRRVAVW